MLSFSTKALELPPEDSGPVDVIESKELSKVMAGMKTGKKENPKPLVEKVAEAKPVDDAVGKVSEKPPVITETAPKPQPKVEEKPVEKKPDPPKVVEKKEEPPKEEPKPVEKKPEPVKPDPIAEALKKEEKKPPPKPVQAAKPPEQQKRIVDRHFDQSQIAALLDKRDPTRQAATGATMNSNAALGLAKGTAADNSATWGSMFQRQVERCWKEAYGGIESQRPEAVFAIRLRRDGTLEGNPVPEGVPATPFLKVYQESAYRAILECQPYKLPEAMYEEWKYFAPVFKEKV